MTVLKEFMRSLVCCLVVNKFILERKQKAMKRFIKGAAVVTVSVTPISADCPT